MIQQRIPAASQVLAQTPGPRLGYSSCKTPPPIKKRPSQSAAKRKGPGDSDKASMRLSFAGYAVLDRAVTEFNRIPVY